MADLREVKIAIGSDHRGFRLKEALKSFMEEKGISYEDLGTHSEESFDYPDVAIPLAEKVARGDYDFGILICMTGIGMSIAANKVKGVRAALVYTPEFAEKARAHNNANVLCMPGGHISVDAAQRALELFLTTEFEGGRHERRLKKIEAYEREV